MSNKVKGEADNSGERCLSSLICRSSNIYTLSMANPKYLTTSKWDQAINYISPELSSSHFKVQMCSVSIQIQDVDGWKPQQRLLLWLRTSDSVSCAFGVMTHHHTVGQCSLSYSIVNMTTYCSYFTCAILCLLPFLIYFCEHYLRTSHAGLHLSGYYTFHNIHVQTNVILPLCYAKDFGNNCGIIFFFSFCLF